MGKRRIAQSIIEYLLLVLVGIATMVVAGGQIRNAIQNGLEQTISTVGGM